MSIPSKNDQLGRALDPGAVRPLPASQEGVGSPPREDSAEAVARLEAIFASTLDPIVTIDTHGIIQSASDSVERVFGWRPDELIGRNITVLMPEPYRSSHDQHLSRYRETGVTSILGRTRELIGRKKDGTEFAIEVSVSRVDVPGHSEPLFTGIIHDICDRKRVEADLARQQERLQELVEERTRSLEETYDKLRTADRLASIGTLAAGLGHDMNNILLPLRCRLDALEGADLPESAREHFHSVRGLADYLQHLADGLHLLALDPDDAKASGESTDIATWWDQVGPLLGRSFRRGVTLTVDWPDDLPAIAVPPHRLTQAALNLLVNAAEAVDDHEGVIRIWARYQANLGVVQIGFTDNGCGMTEEVRRQALDPFFTTKRRGLGTGLGLSLVQGVVRSAGGVLDLESEEGNGTTVALRFPIKEEGHAHDARSVSGTAVVYLHDRRLAGLFASLLGAAGLEVELAPTNNLKRADLWVLEAAAASVLETDVAPPLVRIVVGSRSDDVTDDDLIAVADPSDFQEIQSAIEAALRKLA